MNSFDRLLKWQRSLSQVAEVSPHHERAVGELWKMVDDLGIKNALEIGCGEPPYLTARMLRNQGVEVITMVGLSVADVIADLHELPFPDQTFDLVVARHVLEHALCPYLVVSEMIRVSKGYLLVIVPWVTEKTLKWPDHLYSFDRPGWERIFEKLGLEIYRYEEGDHTEQYAIDRNLWMDHEWRYLLKIAQESVK